MEPAWQCPIYYMRSQRTRRAVLQAPCPNIGPLTPTETTPRPLLSYLTVRTPRSDSDTRTMLVLNTMRAVQLKEPGPPSNLQLVELPIPVPKEGQVLIRVKAFGLNRSEILTRQFGRAPIGPVKLPLVLGVEETGIVEAAPGNEHEFPQGAVAMTAVGGMGFAFDGGYAQYVCVSKASVQLVKSEAEKLGWETIGALPVMLQTATGVSFGP